MAASILLPRPDGDDKSEQSESAQHAQINKNNLIAARASINRGRDRPWAGGAPCNCRDEEASSNTLHASATPVILAPEGRPHGVARFPGGECCGNLGYSLHLHQAC